MNYYSFHIGDYRRDTTHLSLLEHGVYRQLLDMYYLSEERIPEETEVVYRRLCARTGEEKKAVDTVLEEFFQRENGWIHKRCEEEIARWQARGWFPRDPNIIGLRPSINEWKEIRVRILARDRYRCAYCLTVGGALEVDHIVPVSRGGSNNDDNLTAACKPCNRGKSNKLLAEWREEK